MSDTTFLISGGFFDAVDSDRLYSADQMNQPYKKLIHDGINREADGTTPGFAVTAGGGMNVLVATGNAMIGGKWAENKAVQTIAVAGNTSGSARIDSIILQCDKSRAVRAVQIVYRQGTTAAPDLVSDDDITELRLANIRVPSAASAIASENITDTRGGAECPWVRSVFDAPDARYIVEEYTESELAGAYQTVKSAIDSIRYAAQSGQPTVALQASDMIDSNLVYLYQGSETGYSTGYLYYYSDAAGAWIRGAQYGASVVDTALDEDSENPVQNKAIAVAIKTVRSFVVEVPGSAAAFSGSIAAGDFAKALATYTAGSGVYAVKDGEVYQLSAASSSTMTFTQMYHGTMNFIKQIQITSADTFTVTNTALSSSAADTSYNNTTSGLTATDVQAAIDENAAAVTNVNGRLTAQEEIVERLNEGGLDIKDEVIEAQITDWLNDHPEATTTIQDGSVTEEKLHPDLQEKMNSVHVDMGANSYKFTFVGQLYTPPSAYVAWGSGPKYDANLRKFVQFLYCAPQHMHSTATWQRVEIDPITLEANTPERVTFYESDGTTVISFDNEASGNSWRIMDDVPGHYQLLKARKQGTATYSYKYNSYDYGKTWIQGTAISMPTSGLDSFDYKLSNGRLLTSYGGPILYSDDDGDTWTSVTPATAGGNYEAECAFIELDKKGTVMAIARYSKSGGTYYGDGRPDPAIISYSHDYGTTWAQWQASESIVDMNAIGCTALVHDGFVELFVSTRWYDGIDNYTNTGKRGCVRHYIATMENALDDAFTDCGIVHYAKGSSAQDLMSGELCLDGFGEGILCIPDSADGTADTCAKWYYKATKQTQYSMIDDTSLAPYKTYSNKKMDALMRVMTQRIDELQLAVSQLSPDVDPPDVEPENILWTSTFDASGDKLITEEFDGYIGSPNTISTAKTTDTFGNYVNLVPAKTCFHIPVTKQNYAIEITQSMTARNDSFCDLGATFYINSELHALSLRNQGNKIKIINAAGNKELKKFADISYPCTITRRVIYRGELGTAEVMVAVNGTVLFESFDCTSYLSDTKLASEYEYYAQGSKVDVSDLCVFAGAVAGFGTDVGVISVKFGEWGADIQQ